MRLLGLIVFIVGLEGMGCSPLEEIASGECGNGVLEEGETCDVHVPQQLIDNEDQVEQFACGDANSVQACRLVCDSSDNCPKNWRCELSTRTCRYPTDTLRVVAGPNSPGVYDEVMLANLSGTSQQLIEANSAQVNVRVNLLGGGLNQRIRAPSPSPVAPIGVGRLALTGRSVRVLAVPTALGVVAYNFEEYDQFVGEPFAIPELSGDRSGQTMSLFKLAGCTGSRVLFGKHTDAGEELCVYRNGGGQPSCKALGPSLSTGTGKLWVVLGNLVDEDEDAIVVGRSGQSVVEVYQPQRRPETRCSSGDVLLDLRASMTLADKKTLAGPPHITDMNGDGRMDVVLPTMDDRGPSGSWQVTLQTDEAFSFLAPFLDTRGIKSSGCSVDLLPAADVELLGPGASLLLVDDINGDALADVVTSRGVVIAQAPASVDAPPKAFCPTAFPPVAETYRLAHKADVNGDGHPDLVETYDEPRVGIAYGHADGLLSRTLFELESPAVDVTSGDFNADGTADVLLLGENGELMLWSTALLASVPGNLGVVTVGRIPGGRSLSTGLVNFPSYEVDGRNDVLVVADTPAGKLEAVILYGIDSGYLVAPYRPRRSAVAEAMSVLPAGVVVGRLGLEAGGMLVAYRTALPMMVPVNKDTGRIEAHEAYPLTGWPPELLATSEEFLQATSEEFLRMVAVESPASEALANDLVAVYKYGRKSSYLAVVQLSDRKMGRGCLLDAPAALGEWQALGAVRNFDVQDLNADGWEDLLLVASETNQLVVVLADSDQNCGFRPAQLVRFEDSSLAGKIPPGWLLDATSLNLDLGSQHELVLLTHSGTYVIDIFNNNSDGLQFEFDPPVVLFAERNEYLFSDLEVSRGSLRAGDINGDGIIEMIRSVDGRVEILRPQSSAVLPTEF